MASVETQVQSAKRMYDARAATYEDSWHPNYSKRFIELSPLQPGQRVLDLCCGTGLDAFLAAAIVGENGEVVCVDASDGSKPSVPSLHVAN
jgi:ubiquinone/menaquinone biosynthesis C-methylase UbiE